MSIPGSSGALFLATAAGAGGYQVERSLRFNSSDSAYLSRTPSSAGNRKTWTWAGWVKRSTTSNFEEIFSVTRGASTRPNLDFYFDSSGFFTVEQFNGSSYDCRLITNAVYRDVSAWYHFVVTFDTTQATAANRAKVYVNGTQVTFSTATYPTQNADLEVNNTSAHNIGRFAFNGTGYFNGYLADIHFIDGQALTPSSFTEVSATTGQLIPKAYSGSYGTNGFKLTFSDNSNTTAATLGKDTSGNGNNFTPTNFSVAAGAGNDSLTDTPTSYGTDTGAGGEVRGNYATLNPLASAGTMSNGNLDGVNGVSTTTHATFAIPASGKWYFETVMTNSGILNLGLAAYRPSGHIYTNSNSVLYSSSGVKNVDGVTDQAYGASFASGDVIGVACDADAGTVTFYKNNTSQGALTHQVAGLFPSFGNGGVSTNYTANFGQRPFAYTAPSGFKALCDTNLPAPVVAKPNTVMDVALYTGTGSAQTISGLGFSPDLVWVKQRNGGQNNILCDVVRGVNNYLVSDSTQAEATSTTITAFNSDGFSVGGGGAVGGSGSTYVGWTWDAGSSTITNTQGSITSSCRTNQSSGFSIVSWTSNAANAVETMGHGLGVAPGFIIVKNRDTSTGDQWPVYHRAFTSVNNYLMLNSTNAVATAGQSQWSTSSTTFGLRQSAWSTANTQRMIAYCFAPVAGYSSFGSYTSNGSSDGPFVYTGFRPRWIMIKCSSSNQSGNAHWAMYDTSRLPINEASSILFANLSLYEFSTYSIDILSNGFKIRDVDGEINGGTNTYIYAAFAESPFNYARAR